ncbi:MAG: dihydropteroate synthase [Firmicutes bacterium]|nr:dihydropteroate synthase [Bacillota bacterium]
MEFAESKFPPVRRLTTDDRLPKRRAVRLGQIKVRLVEVRNLKDARRLLERTGADPRGIEIMAPKARFRVVHVRGLSAQAALILKQEMLARGAEAAIDRWAVMGEPGTGEVVLMGTLKQYRDLIAKLNRQPFGLKQLAEQLRRLIDEEIPREGADEVERAPFLGLPLGERTLIMGILNVTPDSFSDGGQFDRIEAALERGRQIEEEGADILDLGGESTRPGSVVNAFSPQRPTLPHVSEEEEGKRVFPVLEQLLQTVRIPISVDTYKSTIALQALTMGAKIINDVSGLKADPEMARVVADHDAFVVIMHNRPEPSYQDLMADICGDLEESLEIAEQAGINPERVIIDPGIGFGKTAEHNLEVLRRLAELKSLGRPILLGTSRKSFIGRVLGNKTPGERLEGTAATIALGIAAGADIVRVHDVREMAAVAKMSDAVVRG